MILLPLLLQAATPAPEADITVIGAKLRKLQLSIDMPNGHLKTCTVKVSSGDAFIDGQACKAAGTCVDSGVATSDSLLDCINARIVAAVTRRERLGG